MPASPIAQVKNPQRSPLCLRFLTCTLEEAFCVIDSVIFERYTWSERRRSEKSIQISELAAPHIPSPKKSPQKYFIEKTRKTFEKELNTKGRKFDVTVLDPPRKGCTEESLNYAMKLTKDTIIYVSCNPATLARDLKYLIEKGCKVKFIQPFDMFPHTYHVESVAIITIER